jgi:hypothetical protein
LQQQRDGGDDRGESIGDETQAEIIRGGGDQQSDAAVAYAGFKYAWQMLQDRLPFWFRKLKHIFFFVRIIFYIMEVLCR